MQEIYLHDAGGVEPDASDICTDELVCYLDGINTKLGTKEDPRFGEYQEFCASIDEASILKIEPDQISSGKYDGLDLTGDENDSTLVAIKEPENKSFFGTLSILDYVKLKAIFTTPMTEGVAYAGKEYASVPANGFVTP